MSFMRHLAGTGHVPAIAVVAGCAYRANPDAARVINKHLFETVRAAVLDRTGKAYIFAFQAFPASNSTAAWQDRVRARFNPHLAAVKPQR